MKEISNSKTLPWFLWLSAFVGAIYFLVPMFPTTYSTFNSLGEWIWHGCNPKNGFLHGRFVPIAFVIFCWMGMKKAREEEIGSGRFGLFLVFLGLLFYLVSVRTIQVRFAIISLPFTIVGAVWYLYGFKIARHFVFAAFFWWFAIPVPGLKDALTGGLQILITEACYEAGLLVGMDLVREGSKISVSGSDLNIAEGCSGIRSLMALAMIAAVYANYTQDTLWKKAVLFVSALPLAIIGNFGRIFTILLLSHMGFHSFGKGVWHDWAGLLLFFPIALSGLYLIDYLLNLKTRRKKKVKRRAVSRTVKKEAAK